MKNPAYSSLNIRNSIFNNIQDYNHYITTTGNGSGIYAKGNKSNYLTQKGNNDAANNDFERCNYGVFDDGVSIRSYNNFPLKSYCSTKAENYFSYIACILIIFH